MNTTKGKLQNILTSIKTLRMKPLDFILVICLMVASFTPFLLLGGEHGTSRQAQLRVNSQVIKTFDLTKDQTYTYQDADGDINKIEVEMVVSPSFMPIAAIKSVSEKALSIKLDRRSFVSLINLSLRSCHQVMMTEIG